MAGPLIGALRVSLSAETASFEAGMKRAQRTAATTSTSISKSLGAVKAGLLGFASALSVGLIASAIRSSLEYAGSLAEVAQQLGVTAKDLQNFRYAAGQVGVSQEELETGLSKLTITLGKVAAGAKEPAKALDAIGVSVQQLKGKDTGEAFRIIADALEKVSDRSQRAAVEVALFGKTGSKLDNLLSGGSKAINELARANEDLGGVLSDEQIQNADKTADKLRELKTVLSAQIAGVVADNSDAILGLAKALVELVGAISSVTNAWRQMEANFNSNVFSLLGNETAAARARGSAFRSDRVESIPGSSVTIKLPPARGPKPPPGASIKPFLAGEPKKGAADHSAEDALRRSFQFDQDLRRAQMDVLRATQSLATDYVERTTIGIQILDAEKAAYDAELQYQQALFRLTKGKDGLSAAQAGQLKAANDQKDAIERQALLDEEQARRREEFNQLEQVNFDLERDKLQSEQQLATTAKEQRDIQLRLLDLYYRQERARLEAVLADEKATYAAKEEARRRLAGLNQTYANDRQGVILNTQGPTEQFFRDVPKNAAEAQEAMERFKVMGIDTAINGIIALSQNFQDWRDIALQSIKAVLAELLRMQLMKLAFSLFGSAAGAPGAGAGAINIGGGTSSFFASNPIGGFASGGSFMVGGRPGIDKNVMSLNGLPIAKVSYGERVSVSNDNNKRREMPPFVFNNYARMSPDEARRTGAQAAAGWTAEMNRARVKGIG